MTRPSDFPDNYCKCEHAYFTHTYGGKCKAKNCGCLTYTQESHS